MPKTYARYIPITSLAGDFVLLNLLFVAGFCLLHRDVDCFSLRHLGFYAWLNFWWFVLVIVFGAHSIDRNTRKKSIVFAYIRIIVFFFFFFLMYFQMVPLHYYARNHIGYLFVAYFGLLMAWKMGLYWGFLFYRRKGFSYRNVLILGDTRQTRELKHYFVTNRWHGYRFIGFLDNKTNVGEDVVGQWGDLKDVIEKHQVDEVYVALNKLPQKVFHSITTTIADFPVRVRIVPDLGNFSYKSAELIHYGTLPVLKIHPGPLSYWYNRLLKRVFDVFLSLLVILLVLWWLTPLLCLFSRFGSRDGVFFRQQRTCIDGGIFSCLKYRTMHLNADADSKSVSPDDPRITPIGRFLRRFSLDELPQFINVLRGDMSVVGPRPHMLQHTDEYRKLVKRFMLRHTVKPGITGLAQVNGYRGPITSKADIRNRVKFDVNYIENWSFNMDLKIIFYTVWVVLKGERAF